MHDPKVSLDLERYARSVSMVLKYYELLEYETILEVCWGGFGSCNTMICYKEDNDSLCLSQIHFPGM